MHVSNTKYRPTAVPTPSPPFRLLPFLYARTTNTRAYAPSGHIPCNRIARLQTRQLTPPPTHRDGIFFFFFSDLRSARSKNYRACTRPQIQSCSRYALLPHQQQPTAPGFYLCANSRCALLIVCTLPLCPRRVRARAHPKCHRTTNAGHEQDEPCDQTINGSVQNKQNTRGSYTKEGLHKKKKKSTPSNIYIYVYSVNT